MRDRRTTSLKEFFQVFASNNSQKFKAKFAVFNTRNEEVPATVYNGTQQVIFLEFKAKIYHAGR